MKLKSVFFAIALFAVGISNSQVLKPAKWSTATSASSVKAGETIELIFTAKIDNNWYLYSSQFDCEDGPIKTSFTFVPDKSYQLVGDIVPINPIDKHDKIFECDVKIFKGSAEFRQKVKVLSAPLKISGTYEYQVCTELTGQCVPGDGEFSFDNIKVEAGSAKESKTSTEPVKDNKQEPVFQLVTNDSATQETKNVQETASSIQGPILDPSLKQVQDSTSLWSFFLIAFLAGLTALITPCVFPMIPMTVSFFTGRGTKVQALIYGSSIVIIYTLVGVALAPLMGPETANHLSTEWIPNLIFFAVFTVLSQPPDLGNDFNQLGKNAKSVNGIANASPKANIPTIGFKNSPPADDTSKLPAIGPVQEKETSTSVKAMKNTPKNPPFSDC